MGGCWRLSDCQACGTAEGVSRDESFATGSFGRECIDPSLRSAQGQDDIAQ